MRIGVDVDLTLVDTGFEWWEWCVVRLAEVEPYYIEIPSVRSMYEDLGLTGKCSYNLGDEFLNFKETTGKDIFSFWKQEDLYDNLLPLAHSISVMNKLVKAGHDIVFISHCHGGHFSSKVKWLKKYFPFADIGGKGGFIATKEKHLVNVDVIIDDRVENLLRFGKEVIKIYVDTIYQDSLFDKQDIDFTSEIDNTWKSIEAFLEENDFI